MFNSLQPGTEGFFFKSKKEKLVISVNKHFDTLDNMLSDELLKQQIALVIKDAAFIVDELKSKVPVKDKFHEAGAAHILVYHDLLNVLKTVISVPRDINKLLAKPELVAADDFDDKFKEITYLSGVGEDNDYWDFDTTYAECHYPIDYPKIILPYSDRIVATLKSFIGTMTRLDTMRKHALSTIHTSDEDAKQFIAVCRHLSSVVYFVHQLHELFIKPALIMLRVCYDKK